MEKPKDKVLNIVKEAEEIMENTFPKMIEKLKEKGLSFRQSKEYKELLRKHERAHNYLAESGNKDYYKEFMEGREEFFKQIFNLSCFNKKEK